MGAARDATAAEAALLVRITAAGFHDDPVMRWVFPDGAARYQQLEVLFTGLVRDYLPDGGVVHVVDDACASFWRAPSYPHGRTAADRIQDPGGPTPPNPFPDDVLERLTELGTRMREAHPEAPHWYLNVVSTVPERQGEGLGTVTLQPVLTRCDADHVPAYLESTNPRNLSFYRRLGFTEIEEIRLAEGPSLYTMWREPR